MAEAYQNKGYSVVPDGFQYSRLGYKDKEPNRGQTRSTISVQAPKLVQARWPFNIESILAQEISNFRTVAVQTKDKELKRGQTRSTTPLEDSPLVQAWRRWNPMGIPAPVNLNPRAISGQASLTPRAVPAHANYGSLGNQQYRNLFGPSYHSNQLVRPQSHLQYGTEATYTQKMSLPGYFPLSEFYPNISPSRQPPPGVSLADYVLPPREPPRAMSTNKADVLCRTPTPAKTYKQKTTIARPHAAKKTQTTMSATRATPVASAAPAATAGSTTPNTTGSIPSSFTNVKWRPTLNQIIAAVPKDGISGIELLAKFRTTLEDMEMRAHIRPYIDCDKDTGKVYLKRKFRPKAVRGLTLPRRIRFAQLMQVLNAVLGALQQEFGNVKPEAWDKLAELLPEPTKAEAKADVDKVLKHMNAATIRANSGQDTSDNGELEPLPVDSTYLLGKINEYLDNNEDIEYDDEEEEPEEAPSTPLNRSVLVLPFRAAQHAAQQAHTQQDSIKSKPKGERVALPQTPVPSNMAEELSPKRAVFSTPKKNAVRVGPKRQRTSL